MILFLIFRFMRCQGFLFSSVAGPHRRGGLHTESPGRLGRFSPDVVDIVVQHHRRKWVEQYGEGNMDRPWIKDGLLKEKQKMNNAGLSCVGKGHTSDFDEATAFIHFGWGGGGRRPDGRTRELKYSFTAPPDVDPGAIDPEDRSFDDEFDPKDSRPFRSGGIYMASTVDASCQVRCRLFNLINTITFYHLQSKAFLNCEYLCGDFIFVAARCGTPRSKSRTLVCSATARRIASASVAVARWAPTSCGG